MELSHTVSRSAPLSSAFDSLLAATGAFRNLRALALMGMTLLGAALVGGMFGYIGQSTGMASVAVLGVLLALLTVFYGANAVGILLMREAQGQTATIGDALLLSLFSSHRLIAVAILELLIVAALALAIAVIFLICKIPLLGPLLFTVALPLSAVVMGVVIFSLFYIVFPLAGPAVWSGSTTFQTIARLNMIVRTRLIPVVIQQFILFVILLFVAGIIFAIIGLGFSMVTGLSAAIIGSGGGLGGMGGLGPMGGFGAMGYGMSGMGGGAHIIAGGIGGGILFAVAAIIPAMIATKGLCIIYLNGIDGLDFSKAEAQLESGVLAVKKKAEEARERARQLAEQQMQKAREAAAAASASSASTPASAAAPAAGEPVATAALACPSCHAAVTPEDAFCGECGAKLK